jgi:putative transposase
MKIGMGIIKVEISLPEAAKALEEFRREPKRTFELISHEVRSAVSNLFDQLLQTEMSIFLGHPDQKNNKRNGYYERDFALKGVGCIRIKMPIDRKRKFESNVIKRHEQIDPRLKEDLAVLHLAGISTRLMAMLSKRILGVEVSADTVSKSLGVIEDKATQWLTRPLTNKKYWALFVDGTNFRIQRRGSTQKEPSLVVVGINDRNRLSVLAVEPGTKDNVDAWRAVFSELIRRGLDTSQVRIGIMDGLPGLEKLFLETFSKSVTARCWVHALRNALAKTPVKIRDAFKIMAQKVMYASSEDQARVEFQNLKSAMGQDAQRAVHCLEKDLDSLLAHYRFDKKFWRTLRTTNPIERVNKELKRRVKSMETLGERTLETLIAFTAMRLEFYWQQTAVENIKVENLMWVKNRQKFNSVEATAESLIH